MALQNAYKQFLSAPNSSFLADDASLHYITTLTSIKGSSEIIKHLNAQTHDLRKNEEKFLDAVEGANALAVEVHTTIEFLAGGSSYLPSLDDNFIADRIVTLPIIHIVTFDANGKIQQIRLNWDQGSLLKLIDVIGRTGRNWPIRDGKDQIKLIASSVKLAGKAADGPASYHEGVAQSRSQSTNILRDPHASLSLFAPREKNVPSDAFPATVARASSAKPPQRNYHDLFVGNESDQSSPASAETPIRKRDESPSKNGSVLAKAGAGKNFAPSRLFDTEEIETPAKPSPFKEKKYEHFDFGEGQDAPPMSKELKQTRHGSQWNFDDFSTPAKAVPSKVLRTNDVRHWGNEDDEVTESPIKAKKVDKPRKDAETHFEFKDDGTPDEGQRRVVGRPRGQGQNDGLGLYKNNLYDDENGGAAGGDQPTRFAPLADTKARSKDFDAHWKMTDEASPTVNKPAHISEDRAKAVKMMDANWGTYDQSPNQKENFPASPTASRPNTKGPLSETQNIHAVPGHKGINTVGDGMGGRKVIDDGPVHKKIYTTGGDGMGGKKGLGRQWGFGDESGNEEEEVSSKPSKYKAGRPQGKQATGGDFWDF